MNKIKYALIVILAALLCGNLYGAGRGSAPGGPPPAEIGAEEETTLLLIREEEKLARDTYLTFFGYWDDKIFRNIAHSEQLHMNAMGQMLITYDLVDQDPVGDNPVGEFTNLDFQAMYDVFAVQGHGSLYEALLIGVLIEELDISDLRAAIAQTESRPLLNAYTMLLAGAYFHLRSFVAHLMILDPDYEYVAQLLPQDDANSIVGNYDTPATPRAISGHGARSKQYKGARN